MSTSVEHFNSFAAKIFNKLHENFPRPIRINFTQFVVEPETEDLNPETVRVELPGPDGLPHLVHESKTYSEEEESIRQSRIAKYRESIEILNATVDFLVAEGLLRKIPGRVDNDFSYVLTGKAFHNLSLTIDDKVIGRVTVASQITSAVGRASADSLSTLIPMAITGIGSFLLGG